MMLEMLATRRARVFPGRKFKMQLAVHARRFLKSQSARRLCSICIRAKFQRMVCQTTALGNLKSTRHRSTAGTLDSTCEILITKGRYINIRIIKDIDIV
jgi:hypothetical protein